MPVPDPPQGTRKGRFIVPRTRDPYHTRDAAQGARRNEGEALAYRGRANREGWRGVGWDDNTVKDNHFMGNDRTTLSEAEAQFVRAQRVAHLATSDKEGHPYVVPVCYAFDGERFFTPLDEKPKRVETNKLRRVRNIEARHEAALLFDQYDEDWARLGYILVQGRADLLAPGDGLHADALRLLRERYPQYRSMNLEVQRVIVIIPSHVTAWGPAITNAPPLP